MLFRNFAPVLLVLAVAWGASAQSAKEVRNIGKRGVSAIPELQHFLLNPDVKIRLEALRGLVEIGGPRSIDPLLEASRDNDAAVQIAAANGLVAAYLPGFVKVGMTASLRRFGTDVKARFGDTDNPILEPYIKVRPDVIKAIGKLARGGATMDSRANAARALGVLRGNAAIPDLVDALKSRDTELIFESLLALEKIGDASACPGIRFLVRDFDERVQVEALDANGVLVCRDAEADLVDVLNRTTKEKVRRSALSAVAMMSNAANRSIFQTYLVNDDERLRTAAAEGFARLANINDAKTLQEKYAEETRNSTRLAIAFALVMDGNLTTGEFTPLTSLINALNTTAYRTSACSYLTEAAKNIEVRKSLMARIDSGTRDEKIYLGRVLAADGDAASVAVLERLSHDTDPQVAEEGLHSLRNLQTRL